MLACLNCSRPFPKILKGEVEPGGYMLCMGCGHVMTWTDDLQLRELTAKEHTDAGCNMPLMQERAKIVPFHGMRHRGSWCITALLSLIVVMVILERVGVVGILHHAR